MTDPKLEELLDELVSRVVIRRDQPLVGSVRAYEEARLALETHVASVRREALEEALDQRLSEFESVADGYYVAYANQCSKEECKGIDHKMKTGRFGLTEFHAHQNAAQLLGKYRGAWEAIKAIRALKDNKP